MAEVWINVHSHANLGHSQCFNVSVIPLLLAHPFASVSCSLLAVDGTTISLFLKAKVFLFLEFHVNGIIWYVVFSLWLLFLSKIHLKFSLLLPLGFLLSAKLYSIVWIVGVLCICSPVEECRDVFSTFYGYCESC